MKSRIDIALRSMALALICLLAAPSVSWAAPKRPNPEAIHVKIVKRGIGNWACVEEANGIVLLGRITTIDEQAFGMQLENYPEITMINYSDVVRVRNLGLSGKGAAILAGVTVGAAVITGLVMYHAYESNKPKLPTNPGTPTFP
jgi:hypothetical protein